MKDMSKQELNMLIDDLINLKDLLKLKGYHWTTYDCINKACNIIEDIVRNKIEEK